jgi:protein-S-isoprenylcysteine O-methyltransferase Ste14
MKRFSSNPQFVRVACSLFACQGFGRKPRGSKGSPQNTGVYKWRMEQVTVTQSQADAVRFDPWPLVKFALALPVFFALFLFLPAGDWSWARGWLFVAVFTVATVLASVCLWFANPEIYVARSRFHKGTKRWDAVLVPLVIAAMVAILPVAALDDGRFHWLPVSWWVVGGGYLLFLAGYALMAWAEAVNKFFEPTVRIQTDRGHKVIDTGPYAIVRHPGYLSAFFVLPGMALSLGSLWALIPAAIGCAVLVLRTQWEDQTLQAELPGYREYTQRTRYKLLWGVW